jgi:hypothetical protein
MTLRPPICEKFLALAEQLDRALRAAVLHGKRSFAFEFRTDTRRADGAPWLSVSARRTSAHCLLASTRTPFANEESIMSISSVDSANTEALQQAIQAKAEQTTSSTDTAAQLSAFQLQLQQSQAQQASGQSPGHGHHHHGGHHHAQSATAGSASATASGSTSSNSQPSLLSMMNAIPDDLSKLGD